jgi:tRNA dimethylallyltransferase
MNPRIIFLVGPTAIGKTNIALILAKKINAEIISCDSMQVYKGMDIITSKAPLNLRKKIPHHLIDVVSPDKEYNVSKYRKDAVAKIREILKKGKTPFFVGGTGLYMSILIDGIFKARAQSKTVRNRLYKEAEKFGNEYIYGRLKKVDPQAADKIHVNDTKRIIRALEVYEITGKPISRLQSERKGLADKYDIKIFCLNMEREKLYKKIEERVDKMFSGGLAGEVKKLLKRKLSKTASYAIGIRELKGYFDGSYGLEDARRLIKHNTRLYAKRQLTWFRKDKRIHWVNIKGKEKPKEIADRLWKELY